MKATARASSNIAFLKYWGKKDAHLNLPLNPSISMTLDETVSTLTTVEFGLDINHDVFILNEEEQTGEKLMRVSGFLDILRKQANTMMKAMVVSLNTFPTGSGMASSASGFAALAGAGAKALDLSLDLDQLSSLARLGSGSACRSIHGGFVEWRDDHAVQLHDEHHWDHLRDLIIITSEEEKAISSREAMSLTVATSARFQDRMTRILQRAEAMKEAIRKRDFQRLAPLIMEDSDDLQACLKDTTPSIDYLNKTSEQVKGLVRSLNQDGFVAAYSFDAGPNAHIICDSHDLKAVQEALLPLQGVKRVVAGVGPGMRYTRHHLM
ncbi:MAG: diphosphomevalonate decarboxylase [DPANN group archaeon]|nr:diphosphomevalonate decarboxylase [DPANN group archaeon]